LELDSVKDRENGLTGVTFGVDLLIRFLFEAFPGRVLGLEVVKL
jgi:hypothetical protein